jgi:hypothetical protein
MVRILEDVRPANFDMTLTRKDAKCRLRAEVDELASEVTLVLRHVLV